MLEVGVVGVSGVGLGGLVVTRTECGFRGRRAGEVERLTSSLPDFTSVDATVCSGFSMESSTPDTALSASSSSVLDFPVAGDLLPSASSSGFSEASPFAPLPLTSGLGARKAVVLGFFPVIGRPVFRPVPGWLFSLRYSSSMTKTWLLIRRSWSHPIFEVTSVSKL